MKVKLSTDKSTLNYVGTNEKGHSIQLSGDGSAVGPMESVLMAGAGCSAIDIELILTKMRQPLTRLEVEVDGQRVEESIPRVFEKIHLHYKLYGSIKAKKAQEAVEKSVEKYCSVLTMLMSTVEVTYSHEIIEEDIDE